MFFALHDIADQVKSHACHFLQALLRSEYNFPYFQSNRDNKQLSESFYLYFHLEQFPKMEYFQ